MPLPLKKTARTGLKRVAGAKPSERKSLNMGSYVHSTSVGCSNHCNVGSKRAHIRHWGNFRRLRASYLVIMCVNRNACTNILFLGRSSSGRRRTKFFLVGAERSCSNPRVPPTLRIIAIDQFKRPSQRSRGLGDRCIQRLVINLHRNLVQQGKLQERAARVANPCLILRFLTLSYVTLRPLIFGC